MLSRLSRAVDELQSHQPANASLLSDIRATWTWLSRHLAVIALFIVTGGAVLYGGTYLGYRIGESKGETYKLFDELDLKTTAALAKEATVDLRFAAARFASALRDVESQSGLLEANARLEAANKELLKKNSELTLEADAAKRERDKLQAAVERMRRADQAKK